MKKYLFIYFLLSGLIVAQLPKFGEAKGLFLSAGVGPKFPIGQFAETNNPGSSFDIALSYTDNLLIPIFLNLSVGYSHFPGSQDLYSRSDYSSFSSNVITATFGARYYFAPLTENIFLVMPVIEGSLLYTNFDDFHQFKSRSGKDSYNNSYSKFGFQAGAGISMFMMDIMGYYNYLPEHNYISFDIRVRIPIFVSL
jgi:hypothetical protein